MGNDVYANGREVSCKAADGKSICAFPDVCMTPPTPPAGFLPLPYPNTGMASDTTGGSTSVKISGKEVMLKNKSSFKKSTGDEAATRSTPMGLLTHTIKGKVFFSSWSMDVKIEGENVVRHLDMMTHNHMSFPGNSPVWPYCDQQAIALDNPCVNEMKREASACKDYTPHGSKDACAEAGLTAKPGRAYDVEAEMPSGTAENRADALAAADNAAASECLRVRRCSLQPYDPSGCCKAQTPDHMIEASAFFDTGRGKKGSTPLAVVAAPDGKSRYKEGAAPCICAEGPTQNVGTHGFLSTHRATANAKCPEGDLDLAGGGTHRFRKQTYAKAKETAIESMNKAFPFFTCDPACIEHQLDNYHNQCGVDDTSEIKAPVEGKTKAADVEFADANANIRASEILLGLPW